MFRYVRRKFPYEGLNFTRLFQVLLIIQKNLAWNSNASVEKTCNICNTCIYVRKFQTDGVVIFNSDNIHHLLVPINSGKNKQRSGPSTFAGCLQDLESEIVGFEGF